ncbi:hypothetical protein DSL72_009423 [Monilinia vaccinii-corymbosi]|uniref:Cyanovirin-N domain-containing protein n=1 Tax=Monilinia vaccinii-corymbosi TaxID=61207 RepID=A0A8A3PR28_9HELO|nr:hypothetical protein DSL72_009423 [Monilinia vaccinii-corymbosi]
MTKLSFGFLVFILASIINAQNPPPRSSSGFLKHCDVTSLKYNANFKSPDWRQLTALCTTSSGKKALSTLDLNNCIANHEGILEWDAKDANYSASCKVCNIRNKSEFACAQCKKTDGSYSKWTYLKLNEGIAYQDDQLVCG